MELDDKRLAPIVLPLLPPSDADDSVAELLDAKPDTVVGAMTVPVPPLFGAVETVGVETAGDIGEEGNNMFKEGLYCAFVLLRNELKLFLLL